MFLLRANRAFAKMFAAYGLAAFGDYLDFIAVSIVMGFVWKADPMTMALLPLSYAVPGILFSQLAGILADRWNKRNLMIATDLIRAALTLMLIFAPDVWTLLGLLGLRSAVRVFHFPAQQAMTRAVVEPGQLLQAASLNGAVFQLSKVFGPLLGASLASAFSPSACMAVNAACYVLSALLLLSIPARSVPAAEQPLDEKHGSMGKAWKEGWLIVLKTRLLLTSILFALTGLAGIQLIDAQITTLVREVSPERPELLGWLVASIGAGGLAGVFWLRRLKTLTAYGWPLGGGVALIGFMFAAAGFFRPDTPMWFILLSSFAGGIGTGLTSAGMNYIVQKETPADAVGRISGIMESLSGALFVGAPLAGGALVRFCGVSSAFLFVGLAVGVVGIAGMTLRRRLWRLPAPIAQPEG
ncbi:MFS transporter [Cohnella sp.]|uniref:MFS transporter n=1 Tax=Cohnella sp. TaxID=1883426 RepID=UPI00356B4079